MKILNTTNSHTYRWGFFTYAVPFIQCVCVCVFSQGRIYVPGFNHNKRGITYM